MDDRYRLSKEEHDEIYNEIADFYLKGKESREAPRAIITGGQPGSGKGTIAEDALDELAKDGGALVIDTDQLRDKHPDYPDLQRENDRTAASLVHKDASEWASRLTNEAIDKKLNIVIDQTSSWPDYMEQLASKLHSANYQVEFRVMAVNQEVSEQRVLSRYENDKEKFGVGRYVPPEVSKAAYAGVSAVVGSVENNKSVETLKIYDKNHEKLYDNIVKRGEWDRPPLARATFDQERERPLTLGELKEQAALYTELAQKLEKRGADAEQRAFVENKKESYLNRAAAESFRKLDPKAVLEEYPQLAGSYAAMGAIAANAKEKNLPPEMQKVIIDRAKENIADSIEKGSAPQIQRQDRIQPPAKEIER